MKKRIIVFWALLICAILCGCCTEHEWKDATCDAPKICTKCEETEGAPLGHVWAQADCVTAKTCTVCGVVEGEPLGHGTATEANYQDPSVCEVCGTELAPALTPAFVEYEVQGTFMEGVGKVYPYLTICKKDESLQTIAQLQAINYQVIKGSEEYPSKEGYEWRIVDFELVFADNNAFTYGWKASQCFEDYYDIIGHDESGVWNEDNSYHFSVNWHGTVYAECVKLETFENQGWVNRVNTCISRQAFLVPEGYDGVIVGFRDASIVWEEGQYIFDVADENTLFFRLD